MGKHEDRMDLFVLFLKGIRFSLSLGENPIEEYARKYRSKSDAENIAQDWRNVGNDIRTAYGKAGSEERGTR